MSVEDFSSSYNLSLNWGWGLGPFRENIEDISIPSLSVFVDEDGAVQFLNKIYSYSTDPDPIEFSVPPTFSKDNNFIAGLNRAITTIPTYGIISYPIIVPGTKNDLVRFPEHTPPGYFPLIGEEVRGPNGEEYRLPYSTVPVMSDFVTEEDDDDFITGPTYSPAPFRYLMKLGEGWTFKREILSPGERGYTLANIHFSFGSGIFL